MWGGCDGALCLSPAPWIWLCPAGAEPLPSCADSARGPPDGRPGIRGPGNAFPSRLWSHQPQWLSGKEVGGDSSNLGGEGCCRGGEQGREDSPSWLQTYKTARSYKGMTMQVLRAPVSPGPWTLVTGRKGESSPPPNGSPPQTSSLGPSKNAWPGSVRLAHVQPGLNASSINVPHRTCRVDPEPKGRNTPMLCGGKPLAVASLLL